MLEDMKNDTVPSHLQDSFKAQFQRLVVLDYIIRNTGKLRYTSRLIANVYFVNFSTDRGNDNWLVKYQKPSTTETSEVSFVIHSNICEKHHMTIFS